MDLYYFSIDRLQISWIPDTKYLLLSSFMDTFLDFYINV